MKKTMKNWLKRDRDDWNELKPGELTFGQTCVLADLMELRDMAKDTTPFKNATDSILRRLVKKYTNKSAKEIAYMYHILCK
jgi:hypothetical protein